MEIYYLILFLLVLKEERIALKNQIDCVESADTYFDALDHKFLKRLSCYPPFSINLSTRI
jgi:hypothetical protein